MMLNRVVGFAALLLHEVDCADQKVEPQLQAPDKSAVKVVKDCHSSVTGDPTDNKREMLCFRRSGALGVNAVLKSVVWVCMKLHVPEQ